MKILPIATLALSLLALGCSERSSSASTAPESSPTTGTTTPEEAAPHGVMGGTSNPATPPGLVGKVVETMDSGGYTYALVDTGSEEVWVAAPPVKIAVGDEVAVTGSIPMPGFYSKTLDRTFEVIHFAGAIVPKKQNAAPADLPADHGAPKVEAAGVDFSTITRPEGGATVEEIWSLQGELVGSEVTLRGKVVKYNAGILGKNWLHVQDGTGASGTNDITITTSATCEVGDTVLVKGTLVADRDFGSGYKYDLIIEDAEVTVE